MNDWTRLGALFVSGALVASVALACSTESTAPAASADGGADATAVEDSAAADGAADQSAGDAGKADAKGETACNTVVNGAPEATSGTVDGDAPTATGGTIAPGTYFQTNFTVYDPGGAASGPSPSGLHATLVIAGNVMDLVIDLGDGVDRTFRETFTVNGTVLDRLLSCPKPGPDIAAKYSVSGNQLIVYETDPSSGLVAGSTFVKQ